MQFYMICSIQYTWIVSHGRLHSPIQQPNFIIFGEAFEYSRHSNSKIKGLCHMIITFLLTYNMLECHHYPGLIYILILWCHQYTQDHANAALQQNALLCTSYLTPRNFKTFRPSKPFDLQNFKSDLSDLQNFLAFKTFWP